MKQSKGHVMFLGNYEYFKDINGTLYRVSTLAYFANGYRIGAKFEATEKAAHNRIAFLESQRYSIERKP